MAHEIEVIDGVPQMAYVGETPWHGLGTRVDATVSPAEMLAAAGLNWEVKKTPAMASVGGKMVKIGWNALVRSSDARMLDVVSDDWNPVQNLEAFEFFNDFVTRGDMEMHTAGSLKDGQIVWALAKVKDSFDLFGGDQVDSYLHFTNFHKYGFSTDVRFTPIRVVCNNTLTLSLNSKVERMVKYSHRRVFDADEVKVALGIAHEKLEQYKEMATFLGNKRLSNDNVVEFVKKLFPVITKKADSKKDLSKPAATILSIMDTQPGANFARGSWWQALNAVTYYTDHLAGRTNDNRLQSAWYGLNKNVKTNAMELAVEMAKAA